MIQSLYAGATGMEAQQLNLNNIANNIANANTNGFKRQKIEFQDLLYQKPRTAGADVGNGNILPTGVEIGNGTRVVATSKIFSQGTLKQTQNKLDLAIEGDGFFQVLRPDGSFAYSRDGALKQDSNGRVVTSDGLIVQGFAPVPQGATQVDISPEGNGQYSGPGLAPVPFTIQLTRFNNPSGLRSLGNNLYEETNSSGAPQQGAAGIQGMGKIMQYFVEQSNVNVVEEMVNMIQAQRAYELNSKAITTSDEMLSQLANLKR
jgi:flagellar basal-body rod protein FlgG